MAKKFTPLFAVPFGTDGTEGDSSWHPNFLNCDSSDTFATLKDKLLAATKDQHSPFANLAKDESLSDEDPMDELAGFWIIGHREKLMIDASDGGEIGSDSALYRHIHSVKSMIKAGAIRTLNKAE